MSKIQPGHYTHFKGKNYEVLGVARHSETEEALVVYRQLYGDFALWVRPGAMFEEMTTQTGQADLLVKRAAVLSNRLRLVRKENIDTNS